MSVDQKVQMKAASLLHSQGLMWCWNILLQHNILILILISKAASDSYSLLNITNEHLILIPCLLHEIDKAMAWILL
jgi:hypothetical protein